MFKHLLLWAIRGYQRFLSPHKGFSCAYRVHTGGQSCSHFGYRAIERHGPWLGLKLLRRRLDKCAYQAHLHSPTSRVSRMPHGLMAGQAGFVDGCDGCDAPDCGGCDVPDCGSCEGPSCGWPRLGIGGNIIEEACDLFPDACGADRSGARRAREEARRVEREQRRQEVPVEAPEEDSDD